MSVSPEDKHKPELVNIRTVTITGLRFPVSLEISPSSSCQFSHAATWADQAAVHLLLFLRDVLNVSPAFHLLVVEIEGFVSVFDYERIVHGD